MKYNKALKFISSICAFVLLVSCQRQINYKPELYLREEVIGLYAENTDLFEDLVEVISTNERFYENGRINEYEDANITSPYDKGLSFFDSEDKKIIKTFFGFKPYMILYDYARRFVSITFIAADESESFTLLFWLSQDMVGFENYTVYLSQYNVVETMSENCILFYRF